MEETSKKEILEAIQIFSTNMDDQFSGFKKEINNRFEKVENKLDNVDNRIGALESSVNTLESKMDSGFASLSAELAQVKEDLETEISKLDKRSGEDTCATMQDQLKLEVRVKKLEQQMKQMQPA